MLCTTLASFDTCAKLPYIDTPTNLITVTCMKGQTTFNEHKETMDTKYWKRQIKL